MRLGRQSGNGFESGWGSEGGGGGLKQNEDCLEYQLH